MIRLVEVLLEKKRNDLRKMKEKRAHKSQTQEQNLENKTQQRTSYNHNKDAPKHNALVLSCIVINQDDRSTHDFGSICPVNLASKKSNRDFRQPSLYLHGPTDSLTITPQIIAVIISFLRQY